MPTIKCDNCGNRINRCPSKILKYKHHFCSNNCNSKFLAKNRAKSRICIICGKMKKPPEFPAGGNRCRSCVNSYLRAYHKRNAKRLSGKAKEKYKENRESILARDKKYRDSNQAKIRNRNRIYMRNNRAKINAYARKLYNSKSEEQRIEYAKKKKQYHALPAVRARVRKHNRKRRRTDIQFKLGLNLRRRILLALKGETKSASTQELIGCTIPHLIIHLESQFKEGMAWENHSLGGWHIDHIVPCVVFDLSDPDQQRRCFNFSNMQPLWAYENLSKHGRYSGGKIA